MIRNLGVPLDAELAGRIYRAWCAGYLEGVLRWIHEPEWVAEGDAALSRAERGLGQTDLW